VSFARGIEGPRSSATGPLGTRTALVREEQRRSIRTSRLAEGTLACSRCDAPVAIGAAGLPLGAALSCPFCGHSAPLRDFLSLARPTRPARVVVRVIHRQ